MAKQASYIAKCPACGKAKGIAAEEDRNETAKDVAGWIRQGYQVNRASDGKAALKKIGWCDCWQKIA